MTVNLRHKVSQLVDDDKMLLVVRAAFMYVILTRFFTRNVFDLCFAKIAQNYSETTLKKPNIVSQLEGQVDDDKM